MLNVNSTLINTFCGYIFFLFENCYSGDLVYTSIPNTYHLNIALLNTLKIGHQQKNNNNIIFLNNKVTENIASCSLYEKTIMGLTYDEANIRRAFK